MNVIAINGSPRKKWHTACYSKSPSKERPLKMLKTSMTNELHRACRC